GGPAAMDGGRGGRGVPARPDGGRGRRVGQGPGPGKRRRRRNSTVRELRDRVSAEVSKVVVGQRDVVDLLLAAVAVNGHVLLEGVPGTAKTLLANATARALGGSFRRVQFPPALLPSALTGPVTLPPPPPPPPRPP